MINSFRDLEVYKESFDLMITIHELVKKLPDYERFDLASQLRMASKSCPANIAEGWAKRRFKKEFKKYLENAIGSANEMEAHIEIAFALSYIDEKTSQELVKKYQYLGGKLRSLQKNWETF